MYQLQEQEKPTEGVKRIILEQIDESVGLLAGLTDKGDKAPQDEGLWDERLRDERLPDEGLRDEGLRDEAIHQVRKNIKRIRAGLRLVREAVGEEGYRRENVCFRNAGRQLAPLRDSAVMVETLDMVLVDFGDLLTSENKRASTFSESWKLSVRQSLVERQEEVRSRFFGQENIFQEVAESLQAAGRRFEKLALGQDFQIVESGLRWVYRSGRLRMTAAYADGADPVKFHDWRKQVKYLWHQVEILQPVWPVVMAATADELHEISDCLGVAHDMAVLHDFLRENVALIEDGPYLGQLLTHLSQKRYELEQRARPFGRRMYAEEPGAFAGRLAVYWHTWQATGVNGLPPVAVM